MLVGTRVCGTFFERRGGVPFQTAVSPLAPDLRRTVYALFGLAVLCVALAGLYANQYLFVSPLGASLPDISPTGAQLALTFQISAALAVLWALGIAFGSTPAVAADVQHSFDRVTESGRAARVLAVTLAALYTAGRFVFNGETIHAPLQALTDGTALLPFQYRALVPWCVRVLTEAVPTLGRVDLRVVYAPFEMAAAVGVYGAFAYLLRVLGMARPSAAVAALGVFAPLAFNLVAPWRYNAIYFPYDTPSVAAFTLGLALLLDGRMKPYYALFVVATLNRETTCFLTMAYVLLAVGRERPGRVAAHAAAQTSLWVVVKAILTFVYASNAPLDGQTGGLFAGMVGRSARILVSVPGLVYIAFVTMGGLGVVAWLLRGRVSDPRLGRLAWVGVPFLAGMAVVGELMEVRIYSELIPLVAAALVLAVRSVVLEAAASAAAAAPEVNPAMSLAEGTR